MPHLNINGTDLFYQIEGSGQETLVFAHGLLFSSEMFRDQISYFKNTYRCVSIDFKGQGKSAVAKEGYDMDTLALETLQILDHLKIDRFHFAGLSMGGFIGMRLALKIPNRIISLILLNTTAEEEPNENIPRYTKLNFISRWFGLSLVVNKVLPILFSQRFLQNPENKELIGKWKKRITSNHKLGITRAVKGVIHRKSVDRVNEIQTPTLILCGEFDVATTPDKSDKLHSAINGSELVIIPDAGHSSSIENPQKVIESIDMFLSKNSTSL